MTVPIGLILSGDSPRSQGKDADHAARLAELDAPLPPILVDRRTMRVIDGTHRLMAATLKGQESIDVEFFDGTAEEAFLRAVEANVAHGLPLPHADRRRAAERIIRSHPRSSDRAIARSAGLGARTVAKIRREMTGPGQQPVARVGLDGKVRPLNSAEGRRRAAEIITEDPMTSLREVARRAGISPATVSDVRKRLASGQPPAAAEATGMSGAARADRPRTVRGMPPVPSPPAAVVERLLRDPSLRHKQEGRQLLRLLQQNAIGTREWSELTTVVPSHCGALVVDLARQVAETWMEFARELDEGAQPEGHRAAC
ncbi:ParB/RepB/Spo0J family partition protein [Streptomyces avidinii]|uniref:ParB-like chromosome segregation protein Spo0J n=1 Tax=Streptomyces avidinii TaxID=1895 RepID=A0ABS4LHB1_STRAV|nr:ParB/RepB/Spo0J family partition protein [Streptomyces avidinii]MBP2041495.1 ParB-like chromosome segregation protein Spo0J [Streptomyces avidinii]